MLAIAFPFCCLRRYALLVVLKTGVVQPGDTEEGPPRTEGVVPFPRSERGGSGVAAQGVLQSLPITLALRSEEHTSELQSRQYLVCRLLLEKKKNTLT